MLYNNTDTTTYFANASAADIRGLIDDINLSGYDAAMAARFTINQRFAHSMADAFSCEKTKAVAALDLLAAAKDNAISVDYNGVDISDSNPSGGNKPASGTMTIHTDWQWIGPIKMLTSFWITHKIGN